MSVSALFDDSYHRLFGEGVGIKSSADRFFETFYHHFLANPEVAELFSGTDMSRQAGMLRKSFYHLVAFYVSHEPSAELDRIALHGTVGLPVCWLRRSEPCSSSISAVFTDPCSSGVSR